MFELSIVKLSKQPRNDAQHQDSDGREETTLRCYGELIKTKYKEEKNQDSDGREETTFRCYGELI